MENKTWEALKGSVGFYVTMAVCLTVIGFACGVLNTIPCGKNDPLPKRCLLKLLRGIIRVYVEVFRG